MSSVTLERSCTIPAQTALPRVAQWFEQHGYEIVARSANEMSLFYKAGSMLSGNLHEHKHRLSIRSDGQRITFQFSAGVSDGGLHTAGEKAELERRTDASMAGLTGMPSASAAKRCPACSTIAQPGAAECAVCGTSLA